MSQQTCSCCATKGSGEVGHDRPQCGRGGPAVPHETLGTLLTQKALGRRRAVTYHFCESPTCAVVHYSDNGASCFTRGDLQVQ